MRERVEAAIERLPDGAKGEHARAVLRRTFVRPAPSREAAAEALGLPFSTYRRHLAKAIDELTEQLWAQETGTGSG
jgi:DNA-directed RNA polymerase specialized sigma24 family protein